MSNTEGGVAWETPGTIDGEGVIVTPTGSLIEGDGYWVNWGAWWTFQFVDETILRFDGTGSGDSIDLYLYVMSGGTDQYTADYEDGTGSTPLLQFRALAGVEYRLVMGSYEPTVTLSDYTLSVDIIELIAPTNDDFTNRATLLLNVDDATVVIGAATVETDEVDLFGSFATTDKSVWYEFVPTFSGFISFDQLDCDDGDSANPVWWVCQGGPAIADLTILHGPRFGPGANHAYEVTSGETYFIRIAIQDDDSILLRTRLRRYDWGPWTEQGNVEQPSGGALYFIGGYSAPDEHLIDWPGDVGDTARGDWYTAEIAALYADLIAGFDGHQETGVVPPAGGSGSFITPATATTSLNFHAHQSAGFEPAGQVSAGAEAQVVAYRTTGVNTYSDTVTQQFEYDTDKLIAMHVEGSWLVQKEIPPDFADAWDGTFSIRAYYPSADDQSMLNDDYQFRDPVTTTTIVDDDTGTFDFDLDESDLAGSTNGFQNSVFFYPRIFSNAPAIKASIGEFNDTQLGLLAVQATFENVDWTFRRPDFRELLVVEGEPTVLTIAPLRLYPRDDDLAVGSGRLYPPPSSRQATRRLTGYL